MHRVLLVVVVVVFALAACSSSSARSNTASTTTTAPAATNTCGPAPATPRTAVLCGLQFNHSQSVVVDLHPAATPPAVLVPSGPGVSACPVGPGSFSAWPGLTKCVALDPSRGTALPATSGSMHVAFALRATSTPVEKATVSITYTAADRHFVVAPGAQQGLVVAFTPAHSDVVGVAVLDAKLGFAIGGTTALVVTQGGVPLPSVAATPAARVESNKVVRVAPGVPMLAALRTSPTNVAMLLEWD